MDEFELIDKLSLKREIKFRLWCDNKKEWESDVWAIDKDGDMFDVKRNMVLNPETHILTQFTGLKDKNSKDIYEGDIVKWDDRSNGKYWRVAIVELFPALQFRCFDCPSIENSSAHGYVFQFGMFAYKDTSNHLVIIGNIYENPELLN